MTDKRVVAVDTTNEQAILGAALADAKVREHVVRRLSPDLFLASQHRALAVALRECQNRAMEPTPQALAAHGKQEDWGGEDYVQIVRSAAAPRANLREHVRMLEWDATRFRTLRGSHSALTDALCDPKATPEVVQSVARALLSGLEKWGGRRYLRDPKGLNKSWRAEFAIRRAGGGFVSTGYDALDSQLTEGFAPGKVTVLVGLSGIGKSTMGANLAIRLARTGVRVLFGAWEVGSVSVMDVMVSIVSGVPLGVVMRPVSVTAEDIALMEKAADWITENIRFMDNPFFAKRESANERASNDRNQDLLEGYLAESGCDVIFCDLWERMLVRRDPEQDVAPALYRFHAICEEYGVHGVVLQQLRLKDVEKRSDRRPTRESIKGTSAYVDVADLILGVHHTVPSDGDLELICLKQRKGKEAWAVRFDYDPSRCSIDGGELTDYDPSPMGSGSMPEESAVRKEPSRRRRRGLADEGVL
jgi:replicative DNA helicase